jgi:hypothetical protein
MIVKQEEDMRQHNQIDKVNRVVVLEFQNVKNNKAHQ